MDESKNEDGMNFLSPGIVSYTTKDLVEAAALLTSGLVVLGMNVDVRNNGRTIGYFQFRRDEELNNTLMLLNSGALRVEPKLFHHNMQKLKSSVVCAFTDPATRST